MSPWRSNSPTPHSPAKRIQSLLKAWFLDFVRDLPAPSRTCAGQESLVVLSAEATAAQTCHKPVPSARLGSWPFTEAASWGQSPCTNWAAAVADVAQLRCEGVFGSGSWRYGVERANGEGIGGQGKR